MVLAGNQRLRAYKELERTKVPVAIFTQKMYNDESYQDMCNEIMIKDNINVGTWDWEALHTDYEETQLMEFGLQTFGVNDDFDPDKFFEKKVEFEAKDEHHITLTFNTEQYDAINLKMEGSEATPEQMFYNMIMAL